MREHRQRVSSQRVMARARGERERIGCRGAGTKSTVASEVVSKRAGKSAPPCAVCSVLLSFRACAGPLWAVVGGETKLKYSMIMMLTPLCREGLRGRRVGGPQQRPQGEKVTWRAHCALHTY